MMGRGGIGFIVLMLASASMFGQTPTRLHRWDRTLSRTVTVIDANEQGLRVAGSPGQPAELIGWHEIRLVEGPDTSRAEPYMETGRLLWRALRRIERGDHVTAEPMLETLLGQYESQPGPTSEAVWRGLVECRLGRSAMGSATLAWLHAVNARADHEVDGLGLRVLDGSLPPVWGDPGDAAVIARADLSEITDRPGTVAGALVRIYQTAALAETGVADPAAIRAGLASLRAGLPASVLSHSAVELVLAIVEGRHAGSETRSAARATLAAHAGDGETSWAGAWASLGVGRSLAGEQDPEQIRLGALELLRIPASEPMASPMVTGLGLLEASRAMNRLGDNASAAAIMRELLELHPDLPGIGVAVPANPISTSDRPPLGGKPST